MDYTLLVKGLKESSQQVWCCIEKKKKSSLNLQVQTYRKRHSHFWNLTLSASTTWRHRWPRSRYLTFEDREVANWLRTGCWHPLQLFL